MKVNVIIPVFNESGAIGYVLKDIPNHLVADVIVVNNGSTDNTAQIAAELGATVLNEPVRGYGAACWRGMEYIREKPVQEQPDVVVFLDGDYSDYPEQMESLLQPIADGKAALVIGSRAAGSREHGSMMPQQIFGNWLATSLMKWFAGARFTDLGPFRAIQWSTLQELQMVDRNYGWTVEMQIKAAKRGVPYMEVPVDYRKRIGTSKITGTIKGTLMAGYKIIVTIIKYI
ncbi:MAG: glycosyl hydrolase [Sphingobacteriales bacterium BACL12 MAG-120813-bin55]|jgi:glycosyltransferase involved in cell wall biosynthesis|nr:MAG: glycosyl hydrolase [Sphingobacteriales bacterium BACL12 MAG-120802-bin5]KRP12393.1 MAG: glycosyl hydrolase [Sphingobacteriales bacterium BACL12 MAG-120813-bin55]